MIGGQRFHMICNFFLLIWFGIHCGILANKESLLHTSQHGSLPVFTWLDNITIQVEFPDDTIDEIYLWPADKIANVLVPCLFQGYMETEESADIVVSGCQNDPVVYITIHSSRLPGRNMFTVRNGTSEEINNKGFHHDEDGDKDETYQSKTQRKKRNVIFEDYKEEEYYDYAADGEPDPPPRLKMDVKLGFDQSLKEYLGNETAAREYIVTLFTHGRTYVKHKTLGTTLNLKAVGTTIFAENKHWKANRASLKDSKTMKADEAIPVIYVVYDEDTDNHTGIAATRCACHHKRGNAIVKWRQNPLVAANTLAHESGHLVGLQHEDIENRRSGSCTDLGFMTAGISPMNRTAQFTSCNAARFKAWYNTDQADCLTEEAEPFRPPRPGGVGGSPCSSGRRKRRSLSNFVLCRCKENRVWSKRRQKCVRKFG